MEKAPRARAEEKDVFKINDDDVFFFQVEISLLIFL